MEKRKIGVGIIGASQGGWSVRAHLPALQKLQDLYKVVAVSTTNQKTADATAKEFDVPYAFDNEFDLVNHPEVELVVITV